MRDLIRAHAAAAETLRVHRQQVSASMLKQKIISRASG
jgi:hypothetical protein